MKSISQPIPRKYFDKLKLFRATQFLRGSPFHLFGSFAAERVAVHANYISNFWFGKQINASFTSGDFPIIAIEVDWIVAAANAILISIQMWIASKLRETHFHRPIPHAIFQQRNMWNSETYLNNNLLHIFCLVFISCAIATIYLLASCNFHYSRELCLVFPSVCDRWNAFTCNYTCIVASFWITSIQ